MWLTEIDKMKLHVDPVLLHEYVYTQEPIIEKVGFFCYGLLVYSIV